MGLPDKAAPRGASSFAVWLSLRELAGRRVVFAISVIIIAFLVSLPAALELMGRAKRTAVESRVDYLGPSMSLVPRGISSADLVTAQMKGMTFPEGLLDSILRDNPSLLRAAEARLVWRLPAQGQAVPVVGIDFRKFRSHPFSLFSIRDDEVLLGEFAARSLHRAKGDALTVQNRTFTVAGIVPTAAGIEDVSVFMHLAVLQELTGQGGGINEIRIFARSAGSHQALVSWARGYGEYVDVVSSYRGDVAEREIDAALGTYEKAVRAIALVMAAICIMISTYINLEGRKAEISTIHALGARRRIIMQALSLRTLWICVTGSVVGHVLALAVLFIVDGHSPVLRVWSWQSFAGLLSQTVALGLMVTIPFALFALRRRNLLSHL